MKLSNPHIATTKPPSLTDFIDMAYNGNNAHYIINLEPLDTEDENIKALKTFFSIRLSKINIWIKKIIN
ncbi:MAG TPA: hypothetical protein ACHBX0_13100 [Arsenophonus sp.]